MNDSKLRDRKKLLNGTKSTEDISIAIPIKQGLLFWLPVRRDREEFLNMSDLWVHHRRPAGEVRYRHGGFSAIYGAFHGLLRDVLSASPLGALPGAASGMSGVASPHRQREPRRDAADNSEGVALGYKANITTNRPSSTGNIVSLQQFIDRRRRSGKSGKETRSLETRMDASTRAYDGTEI